MKNRINLLVILAALFASPSLMASINVFACEPEWASLVDELGGERVTSYSATTAYQDPHHIEARPSLIAKIRRADLVVCSGAELEAGWLPLLLKQASNVNLLPGKSGYFEASQQVERLDIPTKADRSQGDIHMAGNPHVHLDPRRVQTIATALTARLGVIDSEGANYYQQRLADFNQRWQQAMVNWQQQAGELKGKRIVVHHRDWVYLFDWLGIEIVGSLEPKPGLPTSAGHLSMLKQKLETAPASLIVRTPYQNPRAANRLSKLTNTPVAVLPYTVGGDEEVENLFDLFSVMIKKLKGEL